jgi:phage tail sheath protein FI
MTSPTYGVIFNSDDTDPRPSQPSDLSVIGLVLPSDDANVVSFPLNVPVAFDTGDPAILLLLGTGPLAKVVVAIDDQLADLQTSARCVAIRVATGTDINGTIANIVGDRASGTGLYALLKAGPMLGVIPRLLGAPGFTGTTNLSVDTVTVTGGASAGGSGYIDAQVVFSPAGGGAAGTAVISGGKVTAVNMTAPGSYPQGTTVTAMITSATGTGATLAVTTEALANPIVAALPEICNALLAHAVVGGPGTGEQDAINWMGTLNSRKLIPVDNWNIVGTSTTVNGVTTITPSYEDGAARVLGLGVRTDFKNGGYPFKSFAGQPVQNILGLKNYYTFSLTDGATQGQELLAAHIGVTERGEIGVETAVSSSGFIFVGTFNADTDPTWWFYNKSRGRDFAHLSLLKSIRLRLGVDNVTPHAVQAVLNDMIAVGQDILSHEGSIGFRVGFEAAVNSADNLRQGKFRVFFQSEEPAPIMQVTIDSRPYYQALEVELATIVAQAATLVPQYLA